jgi:hypothetical protein
MGSLTEQEVLDRHLQALGEAHRACHNLGRNADIDILKPRGQDYGELKEALEALEGSARQMSHFRSDARWVRLGILYAKVMRTAQASFVAATIDYRRWNDFNRLMPLFANGKRHLQDLQARTGTLGPILPQNPSSWLVLPDLRIPKAVPNIKVH